MPRRDESPINPGEVGGPEEDRTPDLLIANDTTANIINGLDGCCGAINRAKEGGQSTERAQGKMVADNSAERIAPYTDRVTECTSASVLCERPAPTREPISSDIIWLGVAAVGCIVFAVSLANWIVAEIRRRAKSKA